MKPNDSFEKEYIHTIKKDTIIFKYSIPPNNAT